MVELQIGWQFAKRGTEGGHQRRLNGSHEANKIESIGSIKERSLGKRYPWLVGRNREAQAFGQGMQEI
jgi:hypothetical protein